MDESTNASELAKRIDLLDAIFWLNIAWDNLSEETIENCFKKCGFNTEDSAQERSIEGM